ncbi:MAG: hypothetical protein ACYSW0_02330, partial [Planctomycetota bacterium]
MERRYLVMMLSCVLTIGSIEIVRAQNCNDLSGLARIRSDFKTKRISSYDRTGGNNDRFENIKAGEV